MKACIYLFNISFDNKKTMKILHLDQCWLYADMGLEDHRMWCIHLTLRGCKEHPFHITIIKTNTHDLSM